MTELVAVVLMEPTPEISHRAPRRPPGARLRHQPLPREEPRRAVLQHQRARGRDRAVRQRRGGRHGGAHLARRAGLGGALPPSDTGRSVRAALRIVGLGNGADRAPARALPSPRRGRARPAPAPSSRPRRRRACPRCTATFLLPHRRRGSTSTAGTSVAWGETQIDAAPSPAPAARARRSSSPPPASSCCSPAPARARRCYVKRGERRRRPRIERRPPSSALLLPCPGSQGPGPPRSRRTASVARPSAALRGRSLRRPDARRRRRCPIHTRPRPRPRPPDASAVGRSNRARRRRRVGPSPPSRRDGQGRTDERPATPSGGPTSHAARRRPHAALAVADPAIRR